MKTYRIYMHPQKPRPVAVKVGFCWTAFLLGPLWFLPTRMWGAFLAVVLLIAGAYLAFSTVQDDSLGLLLVVYFFTWVLIGLSANPLLASHLVSDGYELRGTVRASTLSKATEKALADQGPADSEVGAL